MTKRYRVVIQEEAYKALRKMDGSVRRLILAYIRSRLENIEDPRSLGHALVADRAGQWRYRVGDYRILARIDDAEIVIYIVKVGHRRDVYTVDSIDFEPAV
jgi:mRNA interferase RelE/StbE